MQTHNEKDNLRKYLGTGKLFVLDVADNQYGIFVV
jgi:hypothetical protein